MDSHFFILFGYNLVIAALSLHMEHFSHIDPINSEELLKLSPLDFAFNANFSGLNFTYLIGSPKRSIPRQDEEFLIFNRTDLATSQQKQRSKRGIINLYNMVSCATGCNPVIYKGYGCYCGFLGFGREVDGIDRCCRLHDWCYNIANCPMYLEYFVPYMWKCYRNRPFCAIAHRTWSHFSICAQRLCECDRLLSECLRKYPCPRKRAFCRTSPWRSIKSALLFF